MTMTETERWFERYQVDVPTGESGEWRILRTKVTPGPFGGVELRSFFAGRGFPPGTYTRLMKGDEPWMSDTPAEIRDHAEVLERLHAPGTRTALIHGMGIGMTLRWALLSPSIESVDLVEVNRHVLDLTQDHYEQLAVARGKRLTVHRADALLKQWPSGQRWDVAWHDIWQFIDPDNLADMRRLHRKFGRRSAWQGSWARALCEQEAGA